MNIEDIKVGDPVVYINRPDLIEKIETENKIFLKATS